MQICVGKIKTKPIAWHWRVKLIIEAATSGKMPDLIKKKIDHRLDCHHYHFTRSVSLSLSILDIATKKETREALSINNNHRKKERKELDTLVWKKNWHMWNKDKMERTCVRAYIHARVLMIIKFLATDPVVQHANITQRTVRKREEYRLIKSRTKPDVDEIR